MQTKAVALLAFVLSQPHQAYSSIVSQQPPPLPDDWLGAVLPGCLWLPPVRRPDPMRRLRTGDSDAYQADTAKGGQPITLTIGRHGYTILWMISHKYLSRPGEDLGTYGLV